MSRSLGVRAASQTSGQRARRTHIVLPATAGSLGDQAILCGLAELLASNGQDDPVQVLLREFRPHPCAGARESVRLQITPGGPGRDALALALQACSRLVVLGTDIIDGAYSQTHVRDLVSLSNTCVELGIPVAICAFSFSASPAPEAVDWLRRLHPAVSCTSRDRRSALRFQQHVGRPADVVADPAFNMSPRLRTGPSMVASEWVRARRSQGDVVIGVNANAIADRRMPGCLREAYVAGLSDVMRQRPASVLLIPHDLRHDQSDLMPLDEISRELGARFPGRLHLLPSLGAANEAKALAGDCDLVVTGRLHLAIAAASLGCPAIGIEYHDKFAGIFETLGIEKLLITQADLLERGRLAACIFGALDDLPPLRGELKQSQAAVEDGLSRLARSLGPTG